MIESVKWEGEESKKWHKLSGDKSMIEQIFFFRIFNKNNTQAHIESSHTSTHRKKREEKISCRPSVYKSMTTRQIAIKSNQIHHNSYESWRVRVFSMIHTHMRLDEKREKSSEQKTINLWSERCRPSSGEPPVHLNSWWKLNNVYFMSTKKLFSSSVEFHPSYPVSCVCVCMTTRDGRSSWWVGWGFAGCTVKKLISVCRLEGNLNFQLLPLIHSCFFNPRGSLTWMRGSKARKKIKIYYLWQWLSWDSCTKRSKIIHQSRAVVLRRAELAHRWNGMEWKKVLWGMETCCFVLSRYHTNDIWFLIKREKNGSNVIAIALNSTQIFDKWEMLYESFKKLLLLWVEIGNAEKLNFDIGFFRVLLS